MKLRPLGDRCVIQIVEAESKTESGLYLPDTVDKEKPEQGKIAAVGDGEKVMALGLKKGMTVLFGKYAGSDIELDGKKYKVVGHEDVLAVIE